MDDIETNDTDHKSRLIEWAQKNKKELRFNLVEESGTGQNKLYVIEATLDGEVMGKSSNQSKKKAEQSAAEFCVQALGIGQS